MAIDPERLKAWPFPDLEHTYGPDDVVLYGLGVGYGSDPTDERQLRFVYEDGLVAAPTLPVVLAYPGFWMQDPASGIDWVRVLHAEQSLTLHAPIPTAATVVGRTKVTAVVDKGADKGAVVYQERTVTDRSTGSLLATVQMTTFCRGDGGFGGGDPAPPAAPPVPTGPPALVCELPTMAQAALVYRLSGDRNPLHADPGVARRAGLDRPVLHGLCTFGVAGHAVLRTACGYDPSRLQALSARFSAPVFPGETLRIEMWRRDGGALQFRALVSERGAVVLDRGLAILATV